MSRVSIGIPFLVSTSHPQAESIRRDFLGELDEGNSVAHLARAMRAALEQSSEANREELSQLADSELVQRQDIARLVSDEVWKAHGLLPVSDWQEWRR